MKLSKICLIVIMAAATGVAHAAGSGNGAQQLGKTLTRFGAVQAGNSAGTIPAYTGGMQMSDKAAQEKPYPFAGEKPRLVINAKNMEQYSDKLSAGIKTLMKRYPGYHINVYPTHRTASYPDWLLKKTVENASNPACKLVDNGLGLAQACRRGLPFPVPQNGRQLLWNHLVAYLGIAHTNHNTSIYQTGDDTILTLKAVAWASYPYYAKDPTYPKLYRVSTGHVKGPPRQNGLRQLQWFYMNPADNDGKMKKGWIYQPGLRRLRRLPNASHDTPFAATGGNMVYSEQFLFSGMMDRFDFKLVGRKEMFIPYNNFDSAYVCSNKKIMQPHYANPDCQRWELHRVWVVKATLKPGKHSIYSKRMFYFDEDTYQGGLYDAWDQSGELDRIGYLTSTPLPKYKATMPNADFFYNLSQNSYFMNRLTTNMSWMEFQNKGMRDKPWPARVHNPRYLQGSGIR